MLTKANNKKLQRGQGMTEYIIIVGVIAVAAIGAFGMFGTTIETQVTGMAQELAGSDGSGTQQTAAGTADGFVGKATATDNALGSYHENEQQ